MVKEDLTLEIVLQRSEKQIIASHLNFWKKHIPEKEEA